MDAVRPRCRVVRQSCAPKTFPCPQCGKLGRRKQVHTRRVRDIAYREVLILELEVGEYRARCGCCKTFRAQIEGIEARAEYTNRVREAVIDRLSKVRVRGQALSLEVSDNLPPRGKPKAFQKGDRPFHKGGKPMRYHKGGKRRD